MTTISSTPETVHSSAPRETPPETVASAALRPSVRMVMSSSPSAHVSIESDAVPAMPGIYDITVNDDTAAEYVPSASSPRHNISSEDLDVMQARVKAANAAKAAADAELELAEARARSSRTSRASRTSTFEDLTSFESLKDFKSLSGHSGPGCCRSNGDS